MEFVDARYLEYRGMGQVQSVFDKEVLHQYAECTYFTTKEIVYLYKKFSRLNSTKINPRVGDAITRLTFNEIKALPELHECPFAQRICEVFSTDREEGVNFEDFLDMMSVFSDRAAWNLKAAYAFKIFDFDDDSQINASDIEKTINSLTGNSVAQDEMDILVDTILKEVDTIDSKYITFTEFEHMLARAPDFIRFFRIVL